MKFSFYKCGILPQCYASQVIRTASYSFKFSQSCLVYALFVEEIKRWKLKHCMIHEYSWDLCTCGWKSRFSFDFARLFEFILLEWPLTRQYVSHNYSIMSHSILVWFIRNSYLLNSGIINCSLIKWLPYNIFVGITAYHNVNTKSSESTIDKNIYRIGFHLNLWQYMM